MNLKGILLPFIYDYIVYMSVIAARGLIIVPNLGHCSPPLVIAHQ